MCSVETWAEIRSVILTRDNYSCQICGAVFDGSFPLVVHHKIPWQCGGIDHPNNLITLCRTCHPCVERGVIGRVMSHYLKQMNKTVEWFFNRCIALGCKSPYWDRPRKKK